MPDRPDLAPCPWCGEPTDEGAEHHACMVAHCLECMGRCAPCQDDMQDEAVAS